MLNINSSYENIKAIDKACKSVVKETQASSVSSTSVLDTFERQNNFVRKKTNSGFLTAFLDSILFKNEHVKKVHKILKNNATNLPGWFQTLIGQPHSSTHLSNHLNPIVLNQSA